MPWSWSRKLSSLVNESKGVLAEEGIPCLLQDAEGSGEILRIVGWGSPFGVNVVVTEENAERARWILTEVFGEEN